jgi:uncharacterized protein (TIGR03067 family)
MSRRVGIVALAVCDAAVLAAPVPKQLKKGDHAAILGEWYEPADKKRMWYFHEDGTAGGGDLPDPDRKGLYRIDPAADPKTLDWSADNGKTWTLGLYSLDGDTLTVNIAKGAGTPRPDSLVETDKTHKITATRKKD